MGSEMCIRDSIKSNKSKFTEILESEKKLSPEAEEILIASIKELKAIK